MLNSGVASSFIVKPKITKLLHPSPIFPVTVLLAHLKFIIMPFMLEFMQKANMW